MKINTVGAGSMKMNSKESGTARLKQDDIVILALGQLGGAHKKLFSEHVAAKAYELAPQVFGWELQEYRQKGWPDKEKVRVALIRLRSADGGHLVDGQYYKDTSQDGWNLTPEGVQWLRRNEGRILNVLQCPISEMPKKQSDRFLKQLRRDPLFRLFKENQLTETSRYNFTDMLNCSPDASRDLTRAKFNRLRTMAELASQRDVIDFLEACEKQFGDCL